MEISKLISRIESGRYDEQQLVNLYRNAVARAQLSDTDRESLIEAIELQTRLRFPKAAKKIFGAKEAKARELLQKFYEELLVEYDFGNNRMKNGVKTGGHMLAGRVHIDVYISFKNSSNQVVALALVQESPDSELKARLHRYQAYSGESNAEAYEEYAIDDFDQAKEVYRSELARLVHS